MKKCCRCGSIEPLENFQRRSCSSDGRAHHCRPCASAEMRLRYMADPASFKSNAALWSARNPARKREIAREWKARNPASVTANQANRRARRRAAGKVTRRTASLVKAAARGRCSYCGVAAPLTLDHFDALAAGGAHAWPNLIAVCMACNRSKGAKRAEDWLLEKHGVEGLARAITTFRTTQKIIERLNPEAYRAVHGIDVREV